jgi:lambda family phage portal protein
MAFWSSWFNSSKVAKPLNFAAGRDTRYLSTVPSTQKEINTLIASYGNNAVARARYMVLNDPNVAGAVNALADSIVGSGIKPSSLASDKALREELNAMWLRSVPFMDADGIFDGYGLQRLIAMEEAITGECFIRVRKRRTSDGLEVPVQFQVLPSEMLPAGYSLPQTGNQNRIDCGIEFDLIGRRVAYHFYRQHPARSDWVKDPKVYTRVPAEEVFHVYEPMFAGQIRGVSRMISVIATQATLGAYDRAELERKRNAALFAGFIRRPALDDEDSVLGALGQVANEGITQTEAELSPGAMITLLPGEDVSFSEPADVGANYEPFRYAQQLRAATGLGVPYHLYSGDVSRGNFSSQRIALMEFRRACTRKQDLTLIPMVCTKMRDAWLQAAVGVGAVSLPETDKQVYSAKWIAPRFDWVDPMRDMEAEALAVASGFKARCDVVESFGYDAEEVDERRAQDKEREVALDIAPSTKATEAAPPAGDKSPSPSGGDSQQAPDPSEEESQ